MGCLSPQWFRACLLPSVKAVILIYPILSMHREGCTGHSCSTCRCRQGGCTPGFCSPWSDHRRASLQPAIMKMQHVFFTHLGKLICALVKLTHSAAHSVENSAWKVLNIKYGLWDSHYFSLTHGPCPVLSVSDMENATLGVWRWEGLQWTWKTADDCAYATLYLQKRLTSAREIRVTKTAMKFILALSCFLCATDFVLHKVQIKNKSEIDNQTWKLSQVQSYIATTCLFTMCLMTSVIFVYNAPGFLGRYKV